MMSNWRGFKVELQIERLAMWLGRDVFSVSSLCFEVGKSLPSHPKWGNIVQFFKSNGLIADEDDEEPAPRIIGITNSNRWIFDKSYELIDAGGTYRAHNPLKGRSVAHNYSREESKRLLATNYDLARDVFKYSLSFWKKKKWLWWDKKFCKNFLKQRQTGLYTPHPEFIRQLAQIFIKQFLGGRYIGHMGIQKIWDHRYRT